MTTQRGRVQIAAGVLAWVPATPTVPGGEGVVAPEPGRVTVLI